MKTLLFLGDTHIGSTVALCKPITELDDGGTYHASPLQRSLYRGWQALQEAISKLPSPPLLVINGDIVEIDSKDRSFQIITRNRTTIRSMASEVLDEVAKLCSGVYVVRGTAAHVGKSASMDDAVGDDFDAPGHTKGSHSFWWLPLIVEKVRFDIAHHAPMSGIPWNQNISAINIAARIRFACMERGEKPPDVVIRSHQHRWADSHDAFETRVIQLPAWTYATEFINRTNPGAIADIGAAFITVDNGEYDVTKFKVQPEATKWVKA